MAHPARYQVTFHMGDDDEVYRVVTFFGPEKAIALAASERERFASQKTTARRVEVTELEPPRLMEGGGYEIGDDEIIDRQEW